MTAKEAHDKSMWYLVKPQVRKWITKSIEAGKVYWHTPGEHDPHFSKPVRPTGVGLCNIL